ncbi:MAG: hypothetical protein O2779_00905 [Nanoarchaeota archaeon]|nr:hypothetical protein [Nanoarchaeota archaeon]
MELADRIVSFGEVVHCRVAKNFSRDKLQLHFNKGLFYDAQEFSNLEVSETEYRTTMGRAKDYLVKK